MVKNQLKFIRSRQLHKCQRGILRRDRSRLTCSSRFFNSSVSKMRLYKAMKMAILIPFSWDRCPPTISRKWFLTKIISSSLNRGRWSRSRRWLRAGYSHQLLGIGLQCLEWPVSILQTLVVITNSKWTGFNSYNMNVWRQNLRRNTIRELISFTRELRWGRLSRAHIKTLIWFWCKIIYKIQELWPRGTLREVAVSTHQPISQLHSPMKAWAYLECNKKQEKRKVASIPELTPIQNQKLVIVKAFQEVVQGSMEKTVASNILRSVNNITSSIWIVLKKQLRWWGNSTSLLLSWKCPMKINHNSWLIFNQAKLCKALFYHKWASRRARVITTCIKLMVIERSSLQRSRLRLIREEDSQGTTHFHPLVNITLAKEDHLPRVDLTLEISIIKEMEDFLSPSSKTKTEWQQPRTI